MVTSIAMSARISGSRVMIYPRHTAGDLVDCSTVSKGAALCVRSTVGHQLLVNFHTLSEDIKSQQSLYKA